MSYLEQAQQDGVPVEELIPIDLASYEELVRKIQSQPEQKPITSGSQELDELMGGFEGGRLYALSAPTKMGKSTLAMTMLYQMSKKRIPSLFFSYEMGWKEVAKKFLAMDTFDSPTTPTNLPMYLPLELHRGGGKLQYQWLYDSLKRYKKKE
jgi:replicative DNA helicase